MCSPDDEQLGDALVVALIAERDELREQLAEARDVARHLHRLCERDPHLLHGGMQPEHPWLNEDGDAIELSLVQRLRAELEDERRWSAQLHRQLMTCTGELGAARRHDHLLGVWQADNEQLIASLGRVRRLVTVHGDSVESDDVLAALDGTLPDPHCPGCAPEEPGDSQDPFACRKCGVPEDTCQASPRPCCIVCAEFNVSPHLSKNDSGSDDVQL